MNIEVVIFTNNNGTTISTMLEKLQEHVKPIKYTIYDNASYDDTIDQIEQILKTEDTLVDIFKLEAKHNDDMFYNKYCTMKLQEFNSEKDKMMVILRGNYELNEYLFSDINFAELRFSSYYILCNCNNLLYKYPLIITTNEIWSIEINNTLMSVPRPASKKKIIVDERIYMIIPKSQDTMAIEYIEKHLYNSSKKHLNKYAFHTLCLLHSPCDINRLWYYFHSYIELINRKDIIDKNDTYYLCFGVIDILLQNEIYDRKLITTLAKTGVSIFPDRAEIYNRLGIFYYRIHSYRISYYYYEIALSKNLDSLELSENDNIHMDAYTINNNSEIMISALLIGKKREFMKYKELYEKYCIHSNKDAVLLYINRFDR